MSYPPKYKNPNEWPHDLQAYFLGWFIADGYLGSHIAAEIASVDAQLVQDFATAIEYTSKINTYLPPKAKNVRHRLTFNSTLTQFLIAQGITPGPKTGKEFIPECITTELFPSFLCGVIDGDGSNQLVKTRNTLYTRIVCANKKFLSEIHYNLRLAGVVSMEQIHPHESIWRLAYGKYDSVAIGTYMYAKTPIKLLRKYEYYKKFKRTSTFTEKRHTTAEKLGVLHSLSLLVRDGFLKKDAAKLCTVHAGTLSRWEKELGRRI